MNKIVIFDFNRTIYDPDKRELMTDAKDVFQRLNQSRYKLYLISTSNPSRKELIYELGIEQYFDKIIITENKKKDFEALAKENIDFKSSYVIGDRVKREVIYGNQLGMQTIWLRNGKFANEVPESEIEQPKFTSNILKDILSIIN